jgi:hypothetical protein
MTQAGERAVTSAGKVTKATDEEKQLPRSYQSQWPGGRFVLSFSYLRAIKNPAVARFFYESITSEPVSII